MKNIYKIIGVAVGSLVILYITIIYVLPLLAGLLAVVGFVAVLYFAVCAFLEGVSWRRGGTQ